MRKPFGFTLSELLIALVILGVIATFTIPKVLSSQQDVRAKSIAKETMASISSAYETYSLHNTPTGNTAMTDLTPYLNYVVVDSTTTVDFEPCATTVSCGGAGFTCLKLHNGAMLYYSSNIMFNATATTNALKFHIDPDGIATVGASGDTGKGISAYLYFNGSLRTRGTILPNTSDNVATDNPNTSCDPSWFSWN